jgi:uncharacterized protein (DUF849 family)
MADRMYAAGSKPELEIFNTGDIMLAHDLVADGALKMPALFQIVTGIKYGLASTPEIMCLVKSMLPQPCEWAGFGAGRHSFTMLAQAFILGGHCRHPATPRSSRSPCGSLRTSAAKSPR